MHVALVAPAHECFAREIRGAERGVAGLVVSIPHLLLCGRNSRRQRQLRVAVGKGLRDRHVLIAHGDAAARVIIEQSRGLGVNTVFVEAKVAQRRRPFPVRCLVLAHEHKGFRFVAILQPFERHVTDDIRHVAGHRHPFAHFDHRRIIVNALARENLPEIKAGRIGAEVPFANDGRLVAGLLQELGEGLLRAVERGIRVIGKAVEVTVFSRENRRARRTTNRIRHEAPVEAHPLLRDAIDVRRVEQFARITVGADRLIGVIVGENKDDVRRLWRAGSACNRGNSKEAKQE